MEREKREARRPVLNESNTADNIVHTATEISKPHPVYAMESKEPYKAIILPEQSKVADLIREIFTEEPEKAVAVFRAESGLRPQAQGYNCYYYNDAGQRYSTACEPADRANAWSVDCGIAQLNVAGNVCPAEYFDPKWNIEKALEWKYLPNKRAGGTGWGPWVAEAKGRHLQFLAQQ